MRSNRAIWAHEDSALKLLLIAASARPLSAVLLRGHGLPPKTCGVPAPRTFADVCAATASIIPGIRSIETLPPAVSNREDFFFAGSLNVPDHLIPRPEGHDPVAAAKFLDQHQDRDLACVTLGSVLTLGASTRSAIEHMLDAGVAVISTMQMAELSTGQSELFHYSPFIQMDAICSRVSMMVHHCGNGTYQYAIAPQVSGDLPGIPVLAYRLDELGVAQYLPANDDATAVMETFRQALDVCGDSSSQWRLEATQKLVSCAKTTVPPRTLIWKLYWNELFRRANT